MLFSYFYFFQVQHTPLLRWALVSKTRNSLSLGCDVASLRKQIYVIVFTRLDFISSRGAFADLRLGYLNFMRGVCVCMVTPISCALHKNPKLISKVGSYVNLGVYQSQN